MVTVNLIPESIQAAQARGRHIKRWAACLAVTTIVAVVPVGAHWMQHLRIEELLAQSDKLQTDLAAARVELKTATAAANDAFLRIERAKALRTKRAWSDMLALIGSCLPKDCWLTSIATDPDVPSAAPMVRKASPATEPPSSSLSKGGQRGSTLAPEKPAVVIIDAPRKLRMTGEATDATQPLFFVTRLKESQVFKEVTLERSSAEPRALARATGDDESNFRFELICEW
jgi:Tfp pilus assembly protein PilN